MIDHLEESDIEDRMPGRGVEASPRRLVLMALLGVFVFGAIVLVFSLPTRVVTGRNGQAAIQSLDAMRRPILRIRQVEDRMYDVEDLTSISPDLDGALASADSLLVGYQRLARYNIELSQRVDDLARAFEDWTAVERLLVDRFVDLSTAPQDTAMRAAFRETSRTASSDFLRVLDVLGAGEGPIHEDIESGDRAYGVLAAGLVALLAYLMGVVVWEQRVSAKREAARLQAALSMEANARDLEEQLASALTQVLSGFIPICANCRRVHSRDDQWTHVESYVTRRTGAEFSHGICPECEKALYGNLP